MKQPTENEIRALLGEEVSEEDIKAILAPPSLEPLQEAIDVIPEAERIPPVYERSRLDRLLWSLGVGGMSAGMHTPELTAAIPQISAQTGVPEADILGQMQAGFMTGMRYTAGAPELFVQGALAYWLETEPARIMRKGFRAIPGPGGRIRGKEPTKPFSLSEMVKWGVSSIQGTNPEIEKKNRWSYLIDRMSYTQEEIDATNRWLERHPRLKAARSVYDVTSEFLIGAAFDAAVGYGAARAGGTIKNFFSHTEPRVLKKGIHAAIANRTEELAKDFDFMQYAGGMSMEDARKLFPQDVILKPAIEPRVPRGYKRLYRVEPSPSVAGELPEWIPTEHMGRWFTDKPANLEWYYTDMPPELQPIVKYIDFPEEQAAKYNVTKMEDVKPFSADPETEYFIPKEFLEETKTITDVGAVISGASRLPTYADTDEAMRVMVYRSYIDQIEQHKLIPSNVVEDLIDVNSFGRAKTIDGMNQLELEKTIDDLSVYMNATQDKKRMLAFIDHHLTPKHDTFRRLGLWEYFSDADDGMHFYHNFFNTTQEWYTHMQKEYTKRFKLPWGLEEEAAASYIAERKILPKNVYEPLGNKLGGRDTAKYDEALQFIKDLVDEDKARFVDVLRDEAIRQNKIGPGTDVPVVNYYLYQLTSDRARERLTGARTGYRVTGPTARFINTTPKDMYAPEFLKRYGDIPDEVLEMNYGVRRYLLMRDEGRKLYIQPNIDRMSAVVESIYPDTGETVNKMVRQWYSDWIEKGVYSVPTKFDATLNASMNRASKVMEEHLPSRFNWTASGRAGERSLEWLRGRISWAVLFGNARPMFKNLFQGLLAYPYLDARSVSAGYGMVFTRGGRKLLDDMGFIAARGPRGEKVLYSALDISTAKGWSSLLTYGHIAAVDRYMNCPASFGGALFDRITRSRMKMRELIEFGAMRNLTEGYVKGAGFWDTLGAAIAEGHFKNDVMEAKKILYGTQWYYGRLGASDYLMGSGLRAAAQYSTWPAHFTTVYLRQLITQIWNGETIYGIKATPLERVQILKFIGMAAALSYTGDKAGVNMDFVWNSVFGLGGGPSADFIKSVKNMVGGALTNNERMKDEGWRGFSDQLPIILGMPGYAGGKRAYEVYKGERTPGELFWTPTKEEEEARQPLRPSRPKRQY